MEVILLVLLFLSFLAGVLHATPPPKKIKALQAFKHHPAAVIPTRAHDDDAGLDLTSVEDKFLPVGTVTLVDTGIALNIPPGEWGQISDRSSFGKRGICVMGGVIDAGFGGSLQVMLANFCCGSEEHEGRRGYWVRKGHRVAQIVCLPFSKRSCRETNVLWTSERGSKGLGSSGQ